jgi:glycosidase
MAVSSSVFGPEVQAVFDGVRTAQSRQVRVGNDTITIPTPFPSPQDWRDHWIYFLMIDRFNNPTVGPASTRQNPAVGFDQPFGEFQGGTFDGVMQQLDYIRQLGAGAIWLTPVLKNCQYEKGTFHGYGIQDFLRAEPRFALSPERSDDELRTLVDATHARGMYVIFDIVLNHTGNVFGYVRVSSFNCVERPGDAVARPLAL